MVQSSKVNSVMYKSVTTLGQDDAPNHIEYFILFIFNTIHFDYAIRFAAAISGSSLSRK